MTLLNETRFDEILAGRALWSADPDESYSYVRPGVEAFWHSTTQAAGAVIRRSSVEEELPDFEEDLIAALEWAESEARETRPLQEGIDPGAAFDCVRDRGRAA